jgi:hypothetical protein
VDQTTQRVEPAVSAPAAGERTVAAPPAHEPEGPRPAQAAHAVLVAVGVVAVAYGVLLRLWLLAHLPLFGDEAVVGLMARGIDAGHFSALYWGQQYGGLEPYVAAAVLPVGGGGATALNATAALLGALSAVLVGVITFAVGRNRLLAFAAACVAWVWPFAVVWGSVRELGVHFAALCCGLAAVACCVRAYRGRAGHATFGALGLFLGLGWWASPEILYFALPCLVLLCGWWWNASRARFVDVQSDQPRPTRGTSLCLAAAGFFVGSLPWWYANAHSGFASLRPGVLPDSNGSTFGTRLSVFFHDMLPMQLGARTVLSGSWVGGAVVGKTIFAFLLVLVGAAVGRAVWLSARRPHELAPLALAAGVVTFPFLYAAAPNTGFWIDGRYGVYLPSLIAALFGSVLAVRRGETFPVPRGVSARAATPGVLVSAAFGVLGATCLTVGAAHAAGIPASTSFFSGWQDPNAPMQQVVDAMRSHHIAAAYGDYWTAYDLDFLGGGQPVVSPSMLDVNRSAAIAAQVASSEDPAWLFFAPGQAAAAAFSNPQPGPGPYTEASFEALLRQRGIPFQVVKLGVLDAVVPAHPLATP